VPDEHLANLSYGRRESLWYEVISTRGNLVYVAEAADGNVVDFAAGGRERSGDPVYREELYAIYLLDGWEHRGIGGN
jgi:hypothetical protein